jgi:membrane protease YdiL (CAAX protease family)
LIVAERYPSLLGPEQTPLAGSSYVHVLRGDGYAWWRSVGGVLLALSLYPLLTSAVASLVLGIGYLASTRADSWTAYLAEARRFGLPIGMLAANLALVGLIPLAGVLVWVVHRVRPRWLSSVTPGVRWRYLFVCTAIGLVVLSAVAVLPAVLSGNLAWAPQPHLVAFLAVIVITTPVQAAAEEYLFRGYLLQAFGSLSVTRWAGVGLSALLFAGFHGSQNLPLFVDRLAFGLAAGTLVVLTGGLEAGIGAHVANNLIAYTVAALTSSIADIRAVRALTWPDALQDVGGFVLVAGVALAVARWRGLSTTTPTTSPAQRGRGTSAWRRIS